MAKHYCPKEICDMFAGDEAKKAEARTLSVSWIASIRAQPGDLVYIPHPQTGELLEHVAGKEMSGLH